MEDKELIELAANAAGIEGEWNENFGKSGMFMLRNPTTYRLGFDPLTDDGDALRLAVKLRIDVSHDEIGMNSFVYVRTIFNDKMHIGLSEIFDDEGERHWRTRRAITRAAAQVGKEME